MDKQVLGDYNILKKIGQGSLGSTYLAEHRFIRRQYTLKVLPEELVGDRGFIQRFEDEVVLLSQLEHPNIVKIHNVSFSQGSYFLVSDCVVDAIGETTNLGQYVQNQVAGMKEEAIFSFLSQIAGALNYAHSKQFGDKKGIAHRCLKLNNILVGVEGVKPKLFLSDFGLSRIVGMGSVLNRTYQALADALGITLLESDSYTGDERYPAPSGDSDKMSLLHRSFLQNYAFLSPEQKRSGSSGNIGVEADIYAFGILAYYMLTGEFPEALFEMPSAKVPDYKMDWDLLINGCLQKDPQKRPRSLIKVLEEISKGPHKVPIGKVGPVLNNLNPENESSFKRAEGSFKSAKPVSDSDGGRSLKSKPTGSTVVQQYSPKNEQKERKDIKPILTEMVEVKGSYFYQGSAEGNRDEKPYHQVVLLPFAMEKHPVTNEQFLRFLEFVGGEKDSGNHTFIYLRDSRIKKSSGKLSIESGYSRHSVVGVTWYGALAYARWIGKRLPTEAEWEAASRGGLENSSFPTGDEIEKTQANFFSSDTTVVMSYPANGYGLYDMMGNVYEWCQDWYNYNYYELASQEPENPQGPTQGVYRVLRGGCWKSLKEDMRCSHRHRNKPGSSNSTYGFRCAETLALE